MKGMKIYGSLMPIVIKEVVSTGCSNTKIYDNHGGGQAMLLTQGSWDEVRDDLLRTVSWISARPDEITEKRNTNKGITELSNILTG